MNQESIDIKAKTIDSYINNIYEAKGALGHMMRDFVAEFEDCRLKLDFNLLHMDFNNEDYNELLHIVEARLVDGDLVIYDDTDCGREWNDFTIDELVCIADKLIETA